MGNANEVNHILAAIDRADSGSLRKDITVLGAGMAGLVATYELTRLGHNVTLIEARDEVGGRAWTKHFKNGDYHELGAMRIPKSHFFTRYYIDKCNLNLRRFVNHHDDPDSLYHLRGVASSHKEALTKLVPMFKLSARELSIVTDAGTPLALMSVLGGAIEAVLEDTESMNALFHKGPMTDLIRHYDGITLYEYLVEQLDTIEAVELVGGITGLENLWEKAFSMFLRDEITQQEPSGLDEIVGGTDLLPTGILTLIEKRNNVKILFGTVVEEVHNRSGSVQLVTCSRKDRAQKIRFDTDYVICTLPFSVLRRLNLTGLSAGKNRAIRCLGYASSAKVLFSCRERFWEHKYNIHGSASQQDDINRQVYYPSDNVPTGTEISVALGGVHTGFSIFDKKAQVQGESGKSGALVGSYVWGPDARRLGAVSPEQRVEIVKHAVAKIHPEILDDGMILESASIYWDEYEWASGAFCFMQPTDFQRYYADTIKVEGRLFFAGEHCSLDQGWIQGAVHSALLAVKDLVS